LDDGVVRQIISMIADEGRHTYHYTLLRRWMKATPAVSEGSEMPDFAYLNSKKERCTFEQTRNTEGSTLIVFGANWCDRCKAQQAQAEKTIGDRPIKLLTINIDDNPNGWDANYLKQLSVDHIPYMILVDKRGIVVARDIRIWELERVLKKGK
jgi:glutaredoxin